MPKSRSLVAAVAFVSLLGAACGGDDGGEDGGTAAGGNGGGDTVTLTAAYSAWDPGSLTAPAGTLEVG